MMKPTKTKPSCSFRHSDALMPNRRGMGRSFPQRPRSPHGNASLYAAARLPRGNFMSKDDPAENRLLKNPVKRERQVLLV